jgi:hypothetical protein
MAKVWISQKEYAKHRGVSAPRIVSYRKQGMIPRNCWRKKGRSIEIHRVNADRHLDKALDPGRSVKSRKKGGKAENNGDSEAVTESYANNSEGSKGGGLDMSTARALNEQYKAALKKMEFDRRQGRLISVDDVKKSASVTGAMIKQALLSIPDRVGAMVAVQSSAFECKRILRDEINIILENLSRAIAKIE